MTALEFPTNPTNGQVFNNWTWDGNKWNLTPVAGGGGGAAVAFHAKTTSASIPTGVWQYARTGSSWAFVTNTGCWVLDGPGDGFVVPETGWYLVTYGLFTDAATVDRVILSIEGANEDGWVQEDSAQRTTSSRVVRLTAGYVITPYYYNRGATIDGRFEMSVLKVGGGGGGGGSDGYTFVQDTLPVATTGGQTWFDTSTGDSFVWYDDGTSGQWVQSAPGGGGAQEAVATFGLTTQQTIPTSFADAGIASESIPYGGFTRSGNIITCTKAGTYWFAAAVTINTSPGDGFFVQAYLTKNGAGQIEGFVPSPIGVPYASLSLAGMFTLVPGDTLTLLWQTAGSPTGAVVRSGVLSIFEVANEGGGVEPSPLYVGGYQWLGGNLAPFPDGGYDLCGEGLAPGMGVNNGLDRRGTPGDVVVLDFDAFIKVDFTVLWGFSGQPNISLEFDIYSYSLAAPAARANGHVSPSAEWETSAATIGWFVPAGQEWTYKARITGGTFNGGNCNFGNVSCTHTIVPA